MSVQAFNAWAAQIQVPGNTRDDILAIYAATEQETQGFRVFPVGAERALETIHRLGLEAQRVPQRTLFNRVQDATTFIGNHPQGSTLGGLMLTGTVAALCFTTAPAWAGAATGVAIWAGGNALLRSCLRRPQEAPRPAVQIPQRAQRDALRAGERDGLRLRGARAFGNGNIHDEAEALELARALSLADLQHGAAARAVMGDQIQEQGTDSFWPLDGSEPLNKYRFIVYYLTHSQVEINVSDTFRDLFTSPEGFNIDERFVETALAIRFEADEGRRFQLFRNLINDRPNIPGDIIEKEPGYRARRFDQYIAEYQQRR